MFIFLFIELYFPIFINEHVLFYKSEKWILSDIVRSLGIWLWKVICALFGHEQGIADIEVQSRLKEEQGKLRQFLKETVWCCNSCPGTRGT